MMIICVWYMDLHRLNLDSSSYMLYVDQYLNILIFESINASMHLSISLDVMVVTW